MDKITCLKAAYLLPVSTVFCSYTHNTYFASRSNQENNQKPVALKKPDSNPQIPLRIPKAWRVQKRVEEHVVFLPSNWTALL